MTRKSAIHMGNAYFDLRLFKHEPLITCVFQRKKESKPTIFKDL